VFVSHWLQTVQMLCPRTVCMHQGRIEFDGPTDAAIARYHELLPSDEEEKGAGSVRVDHRELVNAEGVAVGTVHQDDLLTYRVRLRFERPVDSPQVVFQVISEDSTLAYQMQTRVGESWRSFSEGEETQVVVSFRPRIGGGGTFRVAMLVTNTDRSVTLVHDHNGPSFFVAPRLGTLGITDLLATITIDGEHRANHRSLRFESHRAAVEGG
jgi:hypothetical protein